MSESQKSRIQAYLSQGKSLTPLQALKLFGTLRLGARILELRADGLKVVSRMIRVGDKRVARYSVTP